MLLKWPLVGRSDELELIRQVLDAPDSTGVVLAGAAGVGKTRLARAFLERTAASGRSTAWVQATDSARSIPFGAFAHLLPSELSGAGPVNLLRVAGDAIADRSAGGTGQVVVGVDDAHLLDASSAALVGHLAAAGSFFVVATVRSREPVPDAIVSLWKDGPFERIELQSLSEAEVEELMSAALGGHVDGSTLQRLWHASQGNPLYLRELLMGGIETGVLAPVHGVWRWRSRALATPRLTELVGTRLGDLSPAERNVLEVVAHAEPVEAAFVDSLSDGADREAVERRGLLETVTSDRRHMVRLSHPLYSEAVRATTPPSKVPSMWHQLANLLAATGARRGGDLLRLATWRLAAGDLVDVELYVTAARHAIAMQDYSLAERLASAAVEADDRFETCLVLATATIGLGRGDDAERQLAGLERRAESDEQRALAALRRTENLYGLGRLDDASAVVELAASSVASGLWRDALAVASSRLRLFGGRDAEAAVATVTQLLDRPQVSPDVLVEAAPAAIWGQIVTGRTRAALALCERLMPGAEQLAGGRQVMFAASWLRASRNAAALVEGRLVEVERWAVDEYELSIAGTAHELRGIHGFTLGWVQRVVGRPRSAVAVLEETVVVLRDVDLYRHRAACLGELAECHALVGDVDAAETAIAEADATRVPSFVMDYPFVEIARVWVTYAGGEVSLARQIATRCAEQCTTYGQIVFAAFAWHDLARLGEPAAAVEPLRSVAGRVDGRLIPTFAAHTAALVAGDAVGLDGVATAFEEMGAALFAAEAAAEAARLFRHEGRTGSALASAMRARRLAEGCEGARTPALESLDTSLPLTAREHEIAGLAARGLSNREISERLVVSIRTVDNHLHNAFIKLGISHRGDLAAILHPASATGTELPAPHH